MTTQRKLAEKKKAQPDLNGDNKNDFKDVQIARKNAAAKAAAKKNEAVIERDIEPNFEINPKHKQIIMLGRKMETMSTRMSGTDDSSLMMANALSRLGSVLSRFGTGYVKSMDDVVKASALSPQIVQMLIKKAKAEPAAEGIAEGLADMADMSERDHEVQMARAELYKIAKYSLKLHDMLKGVTEEEGIEGWMQSKITKAADYMGSVYHTLEYDMVSENKAKPFKGTMTESEKTEYKAVLEKAKSKAQQKFMGMVHAAQKGEKPASKDVAKVAKSMPKKAAKDYASTKHKGLPKKK